MLNLCDVQDGKIGRMFCLGDMEKSKIGGMLNLGIVKEERIEECEGKMKMNEYEDEVAGESLKN